jgi:hypothetical protein
VYASGVNTGVVIDGGVAGRARLGLLPGGVDNSEFGFKGDLLFGSISNSTLVMNTEWMRITGSGNVGIGTQTPSFKLHVYNASAAGLFYMQSGVASTQITMDDVGGTDVYLTSTLGDFDIWTGGNNRRLTVAAAGNVGIGNTAPAQKLDVSGNVQVPSTNEFMYSAAKTHYYSVPASAFELEGITGVNRTMISGNVYVQNGTATTVAYLNAPVNLPDGAIVTNVTFYVVDNDGTYNLQQGQFWRNDASTSTSYGNVTNMATIPIPGNANSTLIQACTSGAVSVPIDNQNYAYWLRWGTMQANANMRLVKVVIAYTVTKAD